MKNGKKILQILVCAFFVLFLDACSQNCSENNSGFKCEGGYCAIWSPKDPPYERLGDHPYRRDSSLSAVVDITYETEDREDVLTLCHTKGNFNTCMTFDDSGRPTAVVSKDLRDYSYFRLGIDSIGNTILSH